MTWIPGIAPLRKEEMLKGTHEDLAEAEKDLSDAERELEGFERNVRINDPIYSRIWEAKNDVQRKLILESGYTIAKTEDGENWWSLRTDVDEAKLEVKRLQREYEALSLLLRVENLKKS
jgi:hypothetical protein